MSIVDELVAGAENAVPGMVAPWVDKAIEALRAQLVNLPASTEWAAELALERIEAHKDVFGKLSQKAFVALASHLALGDGPKAQGVYLASTASFEERMATLDADAEATQKAAADRSAAWKHITCAVEDGFLGFGKLFLPVLLAL